MTSTQGAVQVAVGIVIDYIMLNTQVANVINSLES